MPTTLGCMTQSAASTNRVRIQSTRPWGSTPAIRHSAPITMSRGMWWVQACSSTLRKLADRHAMSVWPVVKAGGRGRVAPRPLASLHPGRAQYWHQTNSRQPITWRSNPSAELSGTPPARQAASIRSATSRGWSRPMLSGAASSVWASEKSSELMASSWGPK